MRQVANGAEVLQLEGATVGEVLARLIEAAPDMNNRLFKQGTGGPTLNRFVNIYLNEDDIRFLKNLDTPAKPGDVVSIIPAIAGG
jgi:molybdopterin synthase sulfur carrier subunit